MIKAIKDVINILTDEKSEMLFMLDLLLKEKLITDTEYIKAKEKINNTYKNKRG